MYVSHTNAVRESTVTIHDLPVQLVEICGTLAVFLPMLVINRQEILSSTIIHLLKN